MVFTDDDEVHSLNQQFRQQDNTTDVLSFCMQEGQGAELTPGLLGDVVISVERAASQAPDGLEAELVRLMVHGLCHLRGLGHQNVSQRRAMLAEEQRLLDSLPGELTSALT